MREKGWEERGPKAHLKNSDFGTPTILLLFSLVTRIAATSNRKSLATAVATQKITATPKTPVKLRFHCDFCGKSLRLRNCDWQSLAICDSDCVGH